jgi:hypothetical protein
MSQALWCDRGGHAFSDRDPGRKRVAVAGLDDDGNEQDAQYEDICGECIEKSGLLRKARTRPAAQLPGRYDQARTEDLERELGMRDGSV